MGFLFQDDAELARRRRELLARRPDLQPFLNAPTGRCMHLRPSPCATERRQSPCWFGLTPGHRDGGWIKGNSTWTFLHHHHRAA